MERIELDTDTPPVKLDDTGAPVVPPEGGAEGQQEGERTYAGKYNTVEELEKGYLELRKLYSRKTKPDGSPLTLPADTPPETPTPEGSSKLDGMIADATTEFSVKGELSPETRKKLNAVGVSNNMIDQYIAGQTAVGERMQQQVFGLVGGQETYGKLQEWATQTLDPAEKKAFNDVLATNNLALIKMAVQGLNARFLKEGGSPAATTVKGTAAAGGSSGGYESWAQVTADMRSPKYEADPAFRAMVEQKLKRSRDIM